SRLGHRALQPVAEVDMRDVVENVLEGIRTANPEAALQVRVGTLPTAIGNADLLRQVWVNLIGNAVKYSRRRPSPVVEVSGQRENGEVRYTVTDNGAGFDPRY